MQTARRFQKITLVLVLVALAVPAFPPLVHAATCTWTGAVDTDWSKAGNWSGCSGSTPGSTDTAIISWAVSNDPVLSTNATVGSLTVQSGGGALTVNNAFALAGTLTGDGDVTVNGSMDWISGTMSGSGRTVIASAATLTIGGSGYKSLSGRTVENDGAAVWSGSSDVYGSGGAVFDNGGAFEVRNSGGFGGSDVTFNNDGVFTKTLSSGTTTMNAAFNNDGTVDVQSGVLKFSGADYVQTGGVTRLDGGDIDIAYHRMDIQGGTLAGEGAVTGDVLNKGAVMPGNSPGVITVDGDYTQAAAGSLDVEIGGTTAGTGFDQLAVSGDVALAGTLNVTLDGFTPVHGNAFQIVTCDARTGVFQTRTCPRFPLAFSGESPILIRPSS